MACVTDTNSINLTIGADGSLKADAILDPAGDNALTLSAAGLKVSSASLGFPTGAEIDWGGASVPPAGWLFEDGSAVSRSIYSALFSVIGTRYGSGDGATTFNLPGPFSGTRLWDDVSIVVPSGVIAATTEGTAVTVLTGTSITYDGTPLKITTQLPGLTGVAGSATPMMAMFRDGTSLGDWQHSVGGGGFYSAMYHEVYDTPPAGVHIYTLRAWTTSGATSFTVNAGAGTPGTTEPGRMRTIGSNSRIIKT